MRQAGSRGDRRPHPTPAGSLLIEGPRFNRRARGKILACRSFGAPHLFRYFEKLVPPYPDAPPPPLPRGFFAFLWACARGLRRYILAMTL